MLAEYIAASRVKDKILDALLLNYSTIDNSLIYSYFSTVNVHHFGIIVIL